MSASFSAAFLAREPRAERFLPAEYASAEGRRAAVKRAQGRRALPGLGLEPGAVAVVTGQQVGLFLGPLYSAYKAATAIAAARALQAETGVRCVPVFWLQTEDHDFEEIDHVHVLDAKGELVRLHARVVAEPKTSVKHAVFGDDIGAAVKQLREPELWAEHYRPGATWVGAFRGVLQALFPELVVVDPCDCSEAAAPVHARALRDAAEISRVLEARSAELEAAGFDVQVRVKPGAALSFFPPEGPKGPRHRLDAGGEAGLDPLKRPGCFSTSALLRPMLQDTLLPTAAIVGGPGELNYFAQLAPLYAHFGIPMPMLVPRARFRVVDHRARRLLEKLAEPGPETAAGPSPDELERQLVKAADDALAGVPLPDAVKRTRGTIARAASRLAGRYRRHLDGLDTVRADRQARLNAMLEPNGEPQERVLGLPSFPGLDVLPHVDPWHASLKDVSP
ncbi:MAG: bacillithiol biosynthesis BshC [Myxococcaceae bacterium]|nr:bacillithiol biosynthesis BshC [Myxococcaceae bacterium]